MDNQDNHFTATCQVASIFPDPGDKFTDLALHNINTNKDYKKVRAWHNVIVPEVKVGETHKFIIERVLQTKDGRTSTFFNLQSMDIPDVDINQDVNNDTESTPAPKKQTRESKNKAFALSYAKDAAKDYYCARIRSGQEAPNLDKLGTDIITMAKEFVTFLDE